ncbi:MAG TPA: hypothetical protein VF326_14420 [Anaerolineaceae bacterium]|jgi:hypothetical protein
MTQSLNVRKTNPSHKRDDLSDEIRQLRAIIHQVADLAGVDCPPEDLMAVLSTLGEGSARLATLLKTQQELLAQQDPSDEFKQALVQILAELSQAEISKSESKEVGLH